MEVNPRRQETFPAKSGNCHYLVLEGGGACAAYELWVEPSEKDTLTSVEAFDPSCLGRSDLCRRNLGGTFPITSKAPLRLVEAEIACLQSRSCPPKHFGQQRLQSLKNLPSSKIGNVPSDSTSSGLGKFVITNNIVNNGIKCAVCNFCT